MASFIALQDNGNSYVASKLRNRINVASSSSTHKEQYILLMELKFTSRYQGYQSIWSMVDAENNITGILNIKIRTSNPITSFPSSTTQISWVNLKKGSEGLAAPIIVATKQEFNTNTENPYVIVKLYFQPKNAYATALFSIIQESYNCFILQKIANPAGSSYSDSYEGTLLCTSDVIMDNYNTYTNANTATQLQIARTIGITGGATGTATSFDGSSNINIPITALAPESISQGYTKNRFFLQTSVESTGVVIPYLYNDLAHLLKKGGSVNVYYDDTLASTNVEQVFETGFSYWSKSTSGLTSITFEITLHETFTYSNVFWVDSEADSQRAKNIKVEVMNSQYADDVWTVKGNVTNHSESGYYLLLTHTPVGASNTGGGFNKIRITFSNFNGSNLRVGNIGLLKRNGAGIGELCLSRGGADMYGSITCFKNNTYNLGSSDKKWANVYTNNINNIPCSSYLNLKNYLDNSNFLNPINQKGNTSYTGDKYTIDRWKSVNVYGKVDIENNGVKFSNTLDTSKTDKAMFDQYIENNTYNLLQGKKVTLIFTKSDGGRAAFRCTVSAKPSVEGEVKNLGVYTSNDFSIYLRFTSGGNFTVSIGINPGKSVIFKNIALYEGYFQSSDISYHPKEYSQELLECQRYMYRVLSVGTATQHIGMGISSNANTSYVGIKLPTSMRIQPTIYQGNLEIWNGASHVKVTDISYHTISRSLDYCTVKVTTEGSSLTAKNPVILSTREIDGTNVTTSHILFDANLY